MSRADKPLYQQQQADALGRANRVTDQSFKNQQDVYGRLLPALQNELDHPGFTDAEQAALRTATQEGVAGAYDDAGEQLSNHALRSGNSAGLNATTEELARARARSQAQALSGQEGKIAAARFAGQENATRGLGTLFGAAGVPVRAGLGASTELVGDQARLAAQPGFWDRVLEHAINSASDAATTGLGGGQG
ncbi:MAG: hypothetical protein ACYC6M_03630 [Terriglobales bacterium]